MIHMNNRSRLIILLLCLSSCSHEKNHEDRLFSLLPPSVTGIDFRNQLTEDEDFNIIEYLYFNNGAGVAAGDINNDGLADLFFTSNQNSNRLYLNRGNLKFEDITETSGLSGSGNWKTGVTMADVNGDGWLDIYVCHVGNYKNFSGSNQLFINQGDLTFVDKAHDYGLDFTGLSTQAAFFDYDLDGDLDMYLLNHSIHTSRSYGSASLRLERDSLAGDRLFRHEVVNGKHFFQDVTEEAGIYSSQIGYGLGINVCDINDDGFPDIYVSNDFHENDYLYINNGKGTFSERLTETMNHTSRSSMGNDVGDFNNDGLLDVIVLDMLPDDEKIRKQSGGEDDPELFELKLQYGYNYQYVRNVLQLNLGEGMFSEIGRFAGIYSTDWSWSPLFCDLDNDGWKDLFITNGIYRRANDLDYVNSLTGPNSYTSVRDDSEVPDKFLYEKMPLYPNVNYVFRNNHDLTFTNMAREWGFTKKSYSNGATYADLDNDGDLDLIVNNINEHAFVYRNNSSGSTGKHFLSVALKGNHSNTRGIGTRVTLFCQGQKQLAEQFPVRGFLSSTSDILHFGLGSSAIIDSIVIRWPDLKVQKLVNIKADTLIIIDNKDASAVAERNIIPVKEPGFFIDTLIRGLEFRHNEDAYTDFRRELLIPHSLSAEGPAFAVGDINNDGLEDVFAGGASGQKSVLFIQQSDGTFIPAKTTVFDGIALTDAVDAVFFDADNDHDNDLYIVSGGNELAVGDIMLRDYLFINDGNGVFTRCRREALPSFSHNGSCVSPCDYDKDGDIDLFVGSRSVPGAYGSTPDQFILENDGHGNFTDVTDSAAATVRKAGMVTDACWSDFDGDLDADLILTGEWMNISVYRNDNGRFTEVTDLAGMGQTSGWWNCIQAADMDKDGFEDLICGNLGLNSMLKASVTEPVEMYLNDFDNNGTLDQVICSFQNGISYPVASLDELVSQINVLSNKYKKYSGFGGQTITDIFDKNAISQSVLKKAVLFESSIFMNNRDGTFKRIPLPSEAQFSPVRSIVVNDLNADGRPDLTVAGNNYSVRPSLGRDDASFGWVLINDSPGSFNALLPGRSGLAIKGDTRKILEIKISGKQYLLAAVNNGNLQILRFK